MCEHEYEDIGNIGKNVLFATTDAYDCPVDVIKETHLYQCIKCKEIKLDYGY